MLDYKNSGVGWRVPVARWAAWPASSDASKLPDVSFIEPMLRRRLSTLARMSLRVAEDCANGIEKLRFVFSSRHGDLNRTTTLLEALANDEALSPTMFSLSVLNASAGLFSIVHGDPSPATAISAGESSFGYGLLESAAQFAANPDIPVLYVHADEPPSAVYGTEPSPDGAGHALAILLSRESLFEIECNARPSERDSSAEAHAQLFLDSLTHRQAAEWHGGGKCWSWALQ